MVALVEAFGDFSEGPSHVWDDEFLPEAIDEEAHDRQPIEKAARVLASSSSSLVPVSELSLQESALHHGQEPHGALYCHLLNHFESSRRLLLALLPHGDRGLRPSGLTLERVLRINLLHQKFLTVQSD